MTKQVVEKLNEEQKHYCETVSYLIAKYKSAGNIKWYMKELEELWDYLTSISYAKVETSELFFWYSSEDRSTDDSSINTKISYLYRDSCNYKVPNCVVVKGKITDAQIKAIMDCLDSGEYFIPSQVGLPEEKFSTETEDDHPWFELQSDGFTITDKPATEDLTVEELVQNFLDAKGNWKEAF